MNINARKLCADVLLSVYNNNSYLSETLSSLRKKYDISPIDMRFINEVTHGVMKYKIRIDYIISKNSSLRLKKISQYILCILECAVYQIIFMDRVPNEAAVDEAVKLVKEIGQNRACGFVNAVLRSISSNGGNVSYPENEIENFSTYCSIPLWLAKRWENQFGMEEAKKIAKSLLNKGELMLRCNTLKTSPEVLIESLNGHGINAKVHNNQMTDIGYMIECSNMNNLEKLPEFENGHFYVQDFAAALTVEVLAPKSGETVIDMCAAPGGKTTHIAEKMGNNGKVIAFDIHEHKLKRINQNAKRLGIDIICASTSDGTMLREEYRGVADRVLVDAPCSGLGVLRKKPDIKYFRKEEDISELSKTGLSILENASKYLKCGGILVYSTCTIDPCENEDVTKEFLSNHPDFCLEPIKEYNKDNDGCLTLYPHTDGCDGFYICKMKKIR